MINEKFNEDVKEEVRDAVSTGRKGFSMQLGEKFKGKVAFGSKTWTLSRKDRRNYKLFLTGWVVLVILGLVAIAGLTESEVAIAIAFLLAILSIVGLGVGYIYSLAGRYNEEDPMLMRYFHLDYKKNFVTGAGYDNIREISRYEYYGGNQKLGLFDRGCTVEPKDMIKEISYEDFVELLDNTLNGDGIRIHNGKIAANIFKWRQD